MNRSFADRGCSTRQEQASDRLADSGTGANNRTTSLASGRVRSCSRRKAMPSRRRGVVGRNSSAAEGTRQDAGTVDEPLPVEWLARRGNTLNGQGIEGGAVVADEVYRAAGLREERRRPSTSTTPKIRASAESMLIARLRPGAMAPIFSLLTSGAAPTPGSPWYVNVPAFNVSVVLSPMLFVRDRQTVSAAVGQRRRIPPSGLIAAMASI